MALLKVLSCLCDYGGKTLWNRQTEHQSPPVRGLGRQSLLLMFPSVGLKSVLIFDSLRCDTIKTSQNRYQLWNVNGLGGTRICAPGPWSPICGFRTKTLISVEVSLSLHRHWEIKGVRASWRERPGGVTWLSAGGAGCWHKLGQALWILLLAWKHQHTTKAYFWSQGWCLHSLAHILSHT